MPGPPLANVVFGLPLEVWLTPFLVPPAAAIAMVAEVLTLTALEPKVGRLRLALLVLAGNAFSWMAGLGIGFALGRWMIGYHLVGEKQIVQRTDAWGLTLACIVVGAYALSVLLEGGWLRLAGWRLGLEWRRPWRHVLLANLASYVIVAVAMWRTGFPRL